ncbi:MAG: CRISPR-associated helicase Cas3', partial [Desulfobulbus sp.]|nr:CRISPR-associated helicase Cas3' [Desulfobulbus sp.]
SNEDWFSFGTPEDCADLVGWFQKRKACADRALDAIGWYPRTPLLSKQKTFQQVFSFSPRPLQEAIVHALDSLKEPSIILVEAPMGEGKTEAAFFAHLELQRRFGHRGLYIALPTKATGNAMFHRTLTFLRSQGAGRTLDLQLLHGTALLNDSFQNLRFTGIHDPENGGDVRAGEWFTSKKRALLSEYGVGTVDQALVTILPVRHNFVRLWGLANRVVVFDEIHAFDAYTGTLLEYLLRWLLALGSSVILLSATLSSGIRHNLARLVERSLPEKEEAYPRLSVFSPEAVRQWHFPADPARRLTVRLRSISHELTALYSALTDELAERGSGLAIVNTVQRAQELYRLFSEGIPLEYRGRKIGKRLSDGTEVFLFHARFPADWRQQREDFVLATFGKEGIRSSKKILIATQVAEQSLDLDFDVMVTDLAPIDLVLQRAGRLWRHPRNKAERGGVTEPTLLVAGLAGEKPPSFGKPLWWSTVYREDLLLLTWILLRERPGLTLPDEIDSLVQSVYENSVTVPDALQERLETAKMTEEGNYYAYRMQANSAIIGFPDDASWNDSARFILYDEDQPGIHRTLMAQTRLGEESVVAIPLWAQDNFRPEISPDIETAKRWFGRAVRLSRTAIVNKLQIQGVPKGWQELPLLRNCFPLELDERGSWRADETVHLDDELGITFETKEKE